MIDKQAFFLDLVNTIPENTHWSFQCNWAEVHAALSGIPIVPEPATMGLTFMNPILGVIEGLAKDSLFEGINFLEISEDGKKLLEAFDGFIIVIVSKHFNLAGTALVQYLDQDLLFVSDDW